MNDKKNAHRQQPKSMGRKREGIWNIFHAWNRYECHFGCFFFLVTSDVKYSTCTDSSMGTHRFILFLNRYTHHTVSHIQIMVWDEADGGGMEAHTMSFGLFTFTAIISLNARLAQRGRRRFCAMWNDVYSIAAKMICAINNVDKYNILYTTSWVDDF